jgi:hypothetical protein
LWGPEQIRRIDVVEQEERAGLRSAPRACDPGASKVKDASAAVLRAARLVVIIAAAMLVGGCAMARWIPGYDYRRVARGSWGLAAGEKSPGLGEVGYEIELSGTGNDVRVMWEDFSCREAVLPLRGNRIAIPANPVSHSPGVVLEIHGARQATVTFHWETGFTASYRLTKWRSVPTFGCE